MTAPDYQKATGVNPRYEVTPSSPPPKDTPHG